MKTAEPNTVIQRNDSRFIATELGDELVMMDVESGSYIRLNKTAREIWNYLKEPVMVDDLIAALLAKYNVEEEQCKAEVMDCLNRMETSLLVEKL
jgi:Coenzyme PQQ synthesis protein D (PqqD).